MGGTVKMLQPAGAEWRGFCGMTAEEAVRRFVVRYGREPERIEVVGENLFVGPVPSPTPVQLEMVGMGWLGTGEAYTNTCEAERAGRW
jgi:hypothetical protein